MTKLTGSMKSLDGHPNALKKYNAKWNTETNRKTGDLYLKATSGKTPAYGCRLQDHVLWCMGGIGKPLARKSKAAQAWIDWMLN